MVERGITVHVMPLYAHFCGTKSAFQQEEKPMLYQINMITEEDGWIVIDTNGWASEPVRLLVQSVAKEMGKEVFQPYEGDAQYMIKGDPYKLIYQYDDVFGTCVILDKMEDRDEVVALLERHFEKLRTQKEE